MKVILIPKIEGKIPVDGRCINPEICRLDARDISNLELWEGNRKRRLSDLFLLKTEDGDDEVIIRGSVPTVKWIGKEMRGGRMIIEGDVGMHCGSGMSGGEIIVLGSAGSWCGAEMRGGRIKVGGDAAHYVGASYRGGMGMKGGSIEIAGRCGNFAGERMCGGKIEIGGECGLLAGQWVQGGEIIIGGDAKIPGGNMKMGRIVVRGKCEMLPTFRLDGEVEVDGVRMEKFVGDLANDGNGEIYLKLPPLF